MTEYSKTIHVFGIVFYWESFAIFGKPEFQILDHVYRIIDIFITETGMSADKIVWLGKLTFFFFFVLNSLS